MIYAIKPSHATRGHANTKIVFHGYEISISMDDSCGVMQNLCRTQIAVFDKNGLDVTDRFPMTRPVNDDAMRLYLIMQKIEHAELEGL